MSDSTPRQALGQMADGQELDAMQINDALIQLDAFTDIYLLGKFVNTPPTTPADGDMYLTGAAPTGAWTGQSYKLAYLIDGGWRFFAPFNGLRAYVAATRGFLVYVSGSWIDANALISAAEVSLASAATCDLGAAGSLFVAITGATAITSFGTGANLLRFVRFAGALTLTHNATSLILSPAASIVTAAGDSAIFASDGSGNWRCRAYTRASGVPVCFSGLTGSGNAVGSVSPAFTGTVTAAAVSATAMGVSGGNAPNWNFLSYAAGSTRNGYQAGNSNTGAGATNGVFFGVDTAGNATIDYGSSLPLLVKNTGSEVARFGTDGSFLAGTTSNSGWIGSSVRIAAQTATGYAISAQATGAGTALIARVDNTSALLADFRYGGAQVGIITTNGTATNYATTSDARLKEVARDQKDYRGAIRQLWVGDFTWKDSGAPGFGVLAQQAWDAMPNHAGVTRPQDDAGQWHASAEPFAFLALWGVKDLYARIEALAARVAVLEAAHEIG